MSTSECRSLLIFFWFKVIGKIASSHLGRRDEWEGRAETAEP